MTIKTAYVVMQTSSEFPQPVEMFRGKTNEDALDYISNKMKYFETATFDDVEFTFEIKRVYVKERKV